MSKTWGGHGGPPPYSFGLHIFVSAKFWSIGARRTIFNFGKIDGFGSLMIRIRKNFTHY